MGCRVHSRKPPESSSSKPLSVQSDPSHRHSKTDSKSSKPDSNNCIVCLDAPKAASFIHGTTAHLVCCLKCAESISRQRNAACPVCRLPIDSIVQTFL